MSDTDIERLKAELKDANAVIHVLQQEACNRAGVPMPSQRSLVDKLREEIERLRAGRAAVNGFCWGCGATPRYQHKDGCKATKLRVLEVPNA